MFLYFMLLFTLRIKNIFIFNSLLYDSYFTLILLIWISFSLNTLLVLYSTQDTQSV